MQAVVGHNANNSVQKNLKKTFKSRKLGGQRKVEKKYKNK
jgi:hypothetical protein